MRKTAAVSAFIFLVISCFAPALHAVAQEFNVAVSPVKFELTMEPGTSREFEIYVENRGTADQRLALHFMDFYVKPEGTCVFEEPGHYPYSCAKWLSVDVPEFTVPAGQRVVSRFTATAPPDAEPGGHFGAVLFRQVPETTDATSHRGTDVIQIASLALITIPGEILREGEITSVSVESKWFWPTKELLRLPVSPPKYRVAFKNTGNVHLTIRGKLTYTPSFGWGHGTVELKEMTVLPDSERYYQGVIPDPPLLGSYSVKVDIRYGPSLLELDTTRTGTAGFSTCPTSLLLIFLVPLAVLFVLFKLVGRRRKKSKGEK
ncbi:MAG: hypothetical protein KKB90_11540 [Actinobacteria bacterium]|nr:hypothetical protein [Actinomycetota bacterium]MCG2818254.1 hypothetical protein [Actinomycetes bacterium]MBU4219578.1 hypothetical protein [Actinomycetota bacterium]MBU4358791.1 hypothetical protein [Actinomycetota bacterium]MBU4391432.1 hypothetical protein [Actinomycetota bacterium]